VGNVIGRGSLGAACLPPVHSIDGSWVQRISSGYLAQLYSTQTSLCFTSTMPLCVRRPGIVAAPPPVRSFHDWQRAMDDSWFKTQTAFLANFVHATITFPSGRLPNGCVNSVMLRTAAMMARYGMVEKPGSCLKCGAALKLYVKTRTDNGTDRCEWKCPTSGSKHHSESLVGVGPFKRMNSTSWLAFFNLILFLRRNMPLNQAYVELQAAHGNIDDKTFRQWRELYQTYLKIANEKLLLLMIGAPREVAVIDETVVGIHADDGFESFTHKGIGKFSPRVRTSTRSKAVVRKKILKRLPARTIHKKPASSTTSLLMKKPAGTSIYKKPASSTTTQLMKKPAGTSIHKKPASSTDRRRNGRWLWAAVTVGKGNEVYTHANKKKRFTFRFLPKSAMALEGKPKGVAEIRETLRTRIKKGTILVFDGWGPTEIAADEEKFRHAPPVVHEMEFRDRETGFHSNDIESENERLKHWSRTRNGTLRLTELDLHEYSFYINGGDAVEDIMKALSIAGGGNGRGFYLKF